MDNKWIDGWKYRYGWMAGRTDRWMMDGQIDRGGWMDRQTGGWLGGQMMDIMVHQK